MRKIDRIIVHWSASGPQTTVEDIRAWHKAEGFTDIGYHRVILHPDTVPGAKAWGHLVKMGRLDALTGAHTKGSNTGSLGLCVVSGPGYRLHPLQKEALIKTIQTLAQRYNVPLSRVVGHRDRMATQCPGDEIEAVIRAMKG